MGISHNNLAVYERDEFGPSLENAVKIARFFKVPVEYLLFGEKAEFRYHDIDLVDLFGKIDELPAEYREMVKDYIKQILAHAQEKQRLEEKSKKAFSPSKKAASPAEKPKSGRKKNGKK